MKPVFVVLIIIAALLAAATIAGFIFGIVFYHVSMDRYYKGKRVSSMAKNADKDHPLVSKGRDHRREWFSEVSVKKVSLRSFDGLNLSAFLIENPSVSGRFAIVCHGYTGNASEMAFESEHFYNRGFSLLIPSARGHGDSEGDYIGFGWYERKDILCWIDLLNKKYDSPEIVLYGVSMGGATVMMTAGEDLPENVRCAVEDCGFSSIHDEFYHTLISMVKIRIPLILFFANIIIHAKTGINIYRDGSALKQLERSHLPMLFLHGTADKYVPFYMLQKNFDAHPGPKEKLAFEGVPHASAPWDGGDEYWNTVFTFIDKYCSLNND